MASSPAAFLSYAHNDDVEAIDALRGALERAVRHYTGDPTFSIFWDRDHIGWGEQWRRRVDAGLGATTFLLPIVTPSFFRSPECTRELRMFLDRNRGAADRVLPIYYIDAREMNGQVASAGQADEPARLLRDVQYADWRDLRFEPLDSPPVRRAVARLAARVRDLVHRHESAPPFPSVSLPPFPLRITFAVDTSARMAGAPIGNLNHAMRELLPGLRQMADENPLASLEVGAVTFGAHARWVTPAPVPLDQFAWTDVRIDSSPRPNVNAALHALAASMRTMPRVAMPPALVLVLASPPADDISPGLQALFRQPWGRKSVRLGIAIGDDADLDVLRRFIDHPEIEPLLAYNAAGLLDYLKFVDERVDDEEVW